MNVFFSVLKELSERIDTVTQKIIFQLVSVAPCTVGQVPSRDQGSSGFLRSISSAPEQQQQITYQVQRAFSCFLLNHLLKLGVHVDTSLQVFLRGETEVPLVQRESTEVH